MQHVVLELQDFDLAQTFDCGQCFRWDFDGQCWHGIAMGSELFVRQQGNQFDFFPCTQQEFDNLWAKYFDLDTDYSAIKRQLCMDKHVKMGMDYAGGIRILRQEKFETLISFIISANNNIKRIKGMISRICEATGNATGEGYSFPTPQQLSQLSIQDLQQIGAGYRARYIYNTTRAILEGFDLQGIADLEYQQAKAQLCKLQGVGNKVADCVMLFSMGFRRAFPVDTWIKQVLAELYTDCDAKDVQQYVYQKFGENAGLAQQYLFHYARTMKTID